MNNQLTKQMADAIRILAIDAVEVPKSGHPGAPMGMAEMGLVLWKKYLRHNPKNSKWANRDRFVLSNGHASMFIYSLLHLTGYDLSINDLKQFRQLHSKTPGHPENYMTDGIETTTGPLGQGVANAVGMALAEKLLSGEFNKDGMDIVDHRTYCFLGDGCLMEGISHEVCSLAGTLKLNKLTVLYDDNGISIDGDVIDWFDEDVKKRFESYGWNVIGQIDGHNIEAVDKAIADSKNSDKPTLIICKTVIGEGSPNKAGGHGIHGAALGADEIAATRKNLNWSSNTPFEIPSDIKNDWDCIDSGKSYENEWNELFAKYKASYPKEASEFERRMKNEMPSDFEANMKKALDNLDLEKIATRKASQNALDAIAPYLPEFFGGSADLTGSNLTNFKDIQKVTKNTMGNYLSYGVREFGMAAIMNGMRLHAGYLPYGGTFLTFCDYSRNAIRMSALMKIKVIHVFTHDSIGLGEDGPTHQSVEHIPSLRIIPNLDVWRPADSLESFVAWKYALEVEGTPSALIFSRQGCPVLAKDKSLVPQIQKGGYVLEDEDNFDIILIGTGSELILAVEAKEILNKDGIKVRVVSMPSTNVFDKQDDSYKKSVLSDKPVVVVEAAKSDVWYKYIRNGGDVVGMDTFGESAPASVLYKHFNITSENVAKVAKEIING
jgi:transketolase